jgi:hypothetical protein
LTRHLMSYNVFLIPQLIGAYGASIITFNTLKEPTC